MFTCGNVHSLCLHVDILTLYVTCGNDNSSNVSLYLQGEMWTLKENVKTDRKC